MKLLLILLLVFGCSPTEAEVDTSGCPYPDSCNYNPDGTDEESCWYAQNGCLCSDGVGAEIDMCGSCDTDNSNDCIQDECGFWGGDGVCEYCISILYNSDFLISGFQFNHTSCISSIDGGLADEYGFTLIHSETAVIGFSLSGESIPAGEGVLLNLIVDNNLYNSDCLSDFIISDEDANNITSQVILSFVDCQE